MKKLAIIGLIVIVSLFTIGLYQNYQNSNAGCDKWDASPDFWSYTCGDKTYYQHK